MPAKLADLSHQPSVTDTDTYIPYPIGTHLMLTYIMPPTIIYLIPPDTRLIYPTHAQQLVLPYSLSRRQWFTSSHWYSSTVYSSDSYLLYYTTRSIDYPSDSDQLHRTDTLCRLSRQQ